MRSWGEEKPLWEPKKEVPGRREENQEHVIPWEPVKSFKGKGFAESRVVEKLSEVRASN